MTEIEDCGSISLESHLRVSKFIKDDSWIQMMQSLCRVLIDKGTEDEDILEACQCYLNISTSTSPPLTLPSALSNVTWTSPLPKLSSDTVTALTILYSIVFVLAVAGNLAVVGVVLVNTNFRNRATVLIFSLAIADLLIASFCMPFNLTFIKHDMSWTLGNKWCKAVNFIQMFAVFANILTLASIAAERYLAIVHPLWAKASPSMTEMMICVVIQWIAAAIFATPCAVWYHSPQLTDDIYLQSCTITEDDSEKLKLYRLIILLLLFVCPIVLSSILYAIIGYTLWDKNSINLQSSHFEHLRLRKMRRVISMLILILFLFSVCWAPTMMFELLWLYRVIDPLDQVALNTKYYLQWLAMCNSCFNPVVYTFMHEKFRKAVTCQDSRARRRRKNRIQPVSVNAGLQPLTVSSGSSSTVNKQLGCQSKGDITRTTLDNIVY